MWYSICDTQGKMIENKENTMQVVYREAKKNEMNKIAALVSNSFGEYPMYTLTFRDCFGSKETFIIYMQKLNRVHVTANARKHKCFVGEADGRIVSVALLQNPYAGRISLFDYILAGGVGLLFPVGFRRLIDFFDISNQAHADCAVQYPGEWYIELIAISADCKGQGLGTHMLNDCLIPYVKAQGGSRITLITNTEQNCAFYKKNGFVNFAHSKLQWRGKSVQNWSFCKTLE